MNDSTSEPTQPQLTKVCTKCGETKPATTEYFHRNRSRRDGLESRCKTCCIEKSAAYRETNQESIREQSRNYYRKNRGKEKERNKLYQKNNRDALNQRMREYRKRNPEASRSTAKRSRAKNSEKVSERNRQWRLANQEYVKLKNKTYSQANRERLNKQEIERREKKLDEINARRRDVYKQRGASARVPFAKRRARKRSLPDNYTTQDWQNCLDYFGNCCAVCGRPRGEQHTIAADHWIPLSSPQCPGTIPPNVVPLCHGKGGCNNSKLDKDALTWLIRKFGEEQGKAITAKIQAYFDSLA